MYCFFNIPFRMSVCISVVEAFLIALVVLVGTSILIFVITHILKPCSCRKGGTESIQYKTGNHTALSNRFIFAIRIEAVNINILC